MAEPTEVHHNGIYCFCLENNNKKPPHNVVLLWPPKVCKVFSCIKCQCKPGFFWKVSLQDSSTWGLKSGAPCPAANLPPKVKITVFYRSCACKPVLILPKRKFCLWIAAFVFNSQKQKNTYSAIFVHSICLPVVTAHRRMLFSGDGLMRPTFIHRQSTSVGE